VADFAASVHIERSPDAVFAYLTDYANEAQWQGAHVLESRSEPPGPARLGTRVHKARRTPLGTQRFTVEIVEFDPAERTWADRITTGQLRGTVGRWSVRASGEGCDVELRADFAGGGLVGAVVAAIARRTAGKERSCRRRS
jgi:uncharacterized protein YndB with AHSA1/START domain